MGPRFPTPSLSPLEPHGENLGVQPYPSHCRADSGLSPVRTRARRAHMKNSRNHFRLFLMVRYLLRPSFERTPISPACLQSDIYRNIGILFQCLLDFISVVIRYIKPSPLSFHLPERAGRSPDKAPLALHIRFQIFRALPVGSESHYAFASKLFCGFSTFTASSPARGMPLFAFPHASL